ncbi:MAG: cysteine desulfurase [Bacteroidetes bacterium]|nr:cysteine desulfurase [Bacteroidota bacterium]
MVHLPVYMDYHATTPVDARVVEAMQPFFTQHFGNTASVQHRFGWIAKEAVEQARKIIADMLQAEPREILFTSGATESNNLLLKGIAEAYQSKGNHLITSAVEHPAVLETCRYLERKGFVLTILPVDSFGRVNPRDVEKAITEKTLLVSVMSTNNEIGTIQPLEEIGAICSAKNIFFHTDATQGIGKIVFNVKEMNIHALSFSSHKIYGPKGVGVLYLRNKNPKVFLETQMHGGGHERGFRSGTVNVPGIVGLGKAVSLVQENFIDENKTLSELRNLLWEKLQKIENVKLNGDPVRRLSNNLSVTFNGVNADMLMAELTDIALSSGSACTAEDGNASYSHVLKAIGLSAEEAHSTLRFGLGRFTTKEEVNYVSEKITQTVQKLRSFSKEGVR